MKPHTTAAQMRASRATAIRSRPKLYLLAAVAWSAPRALPWSLHGARNGTHLSPVTHTAQKSVSAHRNLGEGARESREQATEAPDVACFRTIKSLTVFWWGSGPQMLPVQQPEWLSDGCQATQAEPWRAPIRYIFQSGGLICLHRGQTCFTVANSITAVSTFLRGYVFLPEPVCIITI